MSSAVFVRTAATHGVALLVGLGFSWVFLKNADPRGSAETFDAAGRPGKRERNHPPGKLTSSDAFRTTYQALASHPISAEERRRVADELFKEWGTRDPLGLLAFVEKTRVWPEVFSFSSHLGYLERDRPDWNGTGRTSCWISRSAMAAMLRSGKLAMETR